MTALASLFAKITEDLATSRNTSLSGFPVSGNDASAKQDIDLKEVSGVSGVSVRQNLATEFPPDGFPQTRMGARAGERVRDPIPNKPELPELPEKAMPTEVWLSGSPSRNPEKEKETGKTDLLRVAPPPAALDGSAAFDERAAFLEYECGLPRGEAEAQARAEFAPASMQITGDPHPQLAFWLASLALLSPDEPPCPGYRGDEWPRTLSRALTFLDTFGAQAEALGWTTERLFGVHPVAGIVRVDACGALVLPAGGAVRAITATEVAFGHLTHRETPGVPVGVAIWYIGR